MDQTSVLLKLNYLMGLANVSSAVRHHSAIGHTRGLDGPEAVSVDWPTNMTSSSPFNFSADTAAGLIEDYLLIDRRPLSFPVKFRFTYC